MSAVCSGKQKFKAVGDCSIFQVAVAVWIQQVPDCVLHQVIKTNINGMLIYIIFLWVYFNKFSLHVFFSGTHFSDPEQDTHTAFSSLDMHSLGISAAVS